MPDRSVGASVGTHGGNTFGPTAQDPATEAVTKSASAKDFYRYYSKLFDYNFDKRSRDYFEHHTMHLKPNHVATAFSNTHEPSLKSVASPGISGANLSDGSVGALLKCSLNELNGYNYFPGNPDTQRMRNDTMTDSDDVTMSVVSDTTTSRATVSESGSTSQFYSMMGDIATQQEFAVSASPDSSGLTNFMSAGQPFQSLPIPFSESIPSKTIQQARLWGVGDPTAMVLESGSHLVDVRRNGLEVSYCKKAPAQSTGTIKSDRPFPARRLVGYFEITISQCGPKNSIAIGVADRNFPVAKMIGLDEKSFAYCGEKGLKYHNNHPEAYGPKFTVGDVVGCGVNFARNEVFYTLNGKHLGVAFRKPFGMLFPTISLHAPKEVVVVNFGNSSFKFDIGGYIEEEKAKLNFDVSKINVEFGDINELIKAHLFYHGYEDTYVALNDWLSDSEREQNSFERQSLAVRKQIRKAIVSGNIQEAISLLQWKHPELLDIKQKTGFRIMFLLRLQQFIELVRRSYKEQLQSQTSTGLLKIHGEMISFATTFLSPYQEEGGSFLFSDSPSSSNEAMDITDSDNSKSSCGPIIDVKILQEAFGLVAFPNPEESTVSRFLKQEHRELVADAVNEGIMAIQCGGETPPNPLLTQLRQLVVAAWECRTLAAPTASAAARNQPHHDFSGRSGCPLIQLEDVMSSFLGESEEEHEQ